MRANRMLYSRLLLQWEVKKMMTAYIGAERQIIESNARGIDITGADSVSVFSDEFVGMQMDEFGNVTNVTTKDLQIRKLEDQLEQLKETGRQLLEDEKYELLVEAQELYDITMRQLNKLRGYN